MGYDSAACIRAGGLILSPEIFRHHLSRILRICRFGRHRDCSIVMASVFAVSMSLVAIAGVLFAPIAGATPGMGLDKTVEAFAVVVVGGLGSVWGSAAAALLFGFLESFGILIVPRFSIAFLFIAMALVLIVRPAGLAGTRE
jgi:branched-subunit amino acid ABC-type transport system permease component